MKKVSVVVPVYKAERTIKKCLNSVLSQDFRGKYEVVVVLNEESPDRTNEIVKDFSNRNKCMSVVYLKENVKGYLAKLKARETGAKAAKYDLLAFTDADCVVRNDWLSNLVKEKPPVIGNTQNDPKKGGIDRFLYLFRKKIYPDINNPVVINKNNFNKIPKGTDNFLCNKRQFFDSLPESNERYVSDDIGIFKNLLKQGTILKSSDAFAYHLERESKRDLMKQWHSRGQAFAGFYLGPGEPYFHLLIFSLVVLSLGIYLVKIWPLILLFYMAGFLLLNAYFCERASDFLLFVPNFTVLLIGFATGLIRHRKLMFIAYLVFIVAVLLI